MRLASRLVAGVVLVAVSGCQPGGRDSKPAAEAAFEKEKAGINRTRNDYVSAWKGENAGEISKLYTEDALVLYPNRPAVVGRNRIFEYFKSFFTDFGQETFELTSAEIEVAGPWAFDRGTYRWKGVPRAGGDPVEDHGKYLVILRREADGSWRIARDMDNSDRPMAQSGRGAG